MGHIRCPCLALHDCLRLGDLQGLEAQPALKRSSSDANQARGLEAKVREGHAAQEGSDGLGRPARGNTATERQE